LEEAKITPRRPGQTVSSSWIQSWNPKSTKLTFGVESVVVHLKDSIAAVGGGR